MTTAARSAAALGLGVLLAVASAAGADSGFDRRNGEGNQVLARIPGHAHADVERRHGLRVVAFADADGPLAVVEGPGNMPARVVAKLLAKERAVESVSPATVAALPGAHDGGDLRLDAADVLPDLLRNSPFASPCFERGFGGPVWSGYGDQELAAILRLHEAHAESAGCGAGVTVAVIDTGVDPTHPLLAGALLPGVDLLTGEDPSPASEWTAVDQSVRAIVEQSVRAIVEESQIAVLGGAGALAPTDEALAPILAGDAAGALAGLGLPPAFGHGTMVAGLVRLVAPAARILPLRAFDGDGRGHVFDVVRAIHAAVDRGADVIVMSFSVDEQDKELARAVERARANGVVSVAAAGNRGERVRVYPAAYGVGVASSDDDDTLSAFSSYGAEVAMLAAPGVGVVSAFPGGLYAAGWGTSFSTPLVAGTVALVVPTAGGTGTTAVQRRLTALTAGAVRPSCLNGLVSAGRLDALGAVRAAKPK